MKPQKITIAIDGYSSTGKSSFAKMVAKEFGLLYLDSGALYRGVTLFARERGLVSSTGEVDPSLKEALSGVDLRFGAGGLYLGGRCVEYQIRSLEVSALVSPVSALPYVRAFVDDKLRESGKDGGIVMDGRDIGTTVFPNAEIKVFMTASEEVRARRRYEEMVAKGETPDFTEVLENLRSRDYMDSHREASPLTQAPDAFVLDNSEMSFGEELAWIRGLIQGKMGITEC